MRNNSEHRYLKGMAAGMIGGLIASWTMNRFQSGLSKAEKALKKKTGEQNSQQQSGSGGDEAATAIMARRLSKAVLHRDLTEREMKIAEPLVHYAFGTLSGAFYGLMTEMTRKTKVGEGTAYATGLWLLGDEIAVPKLQLSKSPTEFPPKAHAEALASHLVYGVTTEEVRRGVRALFS